MLRLAAIEFCERTRCWRYINTQTLTANGPEMSVPAYATIHEIESAFLDDTELTPTQFSDVSYDDLTDAGTDGPARYVTQISPNTVSIYPFEAGDLRLTVFLKPRSGSESGGYEFDPLQEKYNVVPEFMFLQHAEDLMHGALARILELPAQSYTDMAKAQAHKLEFERRISQKFSTNIRGQQRMPMRVKPHFM